MAQRLPETPYYGLMAEFDTAQALLDAAQRVHAAGYRKTDGYSPIPIHGLAESLGFHEHRVAPIILAGGLIGMFGGFGLQYWINVFAYPLNIGGRPDNAWVAFIPPTFEGTILCSVFAAVFSLFVLNRLPQPYHPVFNVPQFERASQDRFFLVIEAADPRFRLEETRAFLAGLHPREVVQVEN
jgi:hypothetical protein